MQWRLNAGYGPMRNHIFPTCIEIHVMTQGIRTQTNFTRNDQQKTAASARAVKALIMKAWL